MLGAEGTWYCELWAQGGGILGVKSHLLKPGHVAVPALYTAPQPEPPSPVPSADEGRWSVALIGFPVYDSVTSCSDQADRATGCSFQVPGRSGWAELGLKSWGVQ